MRKEFVCTYFHINFLAFLKNIHLFRQGYNGLDKKNNKKCYIKLKNCFLYSMNKRRFIFTESIVEGNLQFCINTTLTFEMKQILFLFPEPTNLKSSDSNIFESSLPSGKSASGGDEERTGEEILQPLTVSSSRPERIDFRVSTSSQEQRAAALR